MTAAARAWYQKTSKVMGTAILAMRPLGKGVPPGGGGYLAGTYPGGITTVDGAPTVATVRILYRPLSGQRGDGVVVAEVQSAPDGSWIVEGLDPDLSFDVVGRKNGFNDVIMANVRPSLPTP